MLLEEPTTRRHPLEDHCRAPRLPG
jgi:hypothetical protein